MLLELSTIEETAADNDNGEDFTPTESCVLDVADRGAINLAQIAALMNLSRERARQLESDGLSHLLAKLRAPFDD